MMTPMRWFYSFLKKYRIKMIIGLGLTTIISIISILNPYIAGAIVDDVIKGENRGILFPLVGCLVGAVLLSATLRFSSQVLYEKASQGMLYDMRDKVYRKLLQEDFSFYNRKRTGDLMSRQTGDMEAIRHFTAHTVYTVYNNILLFMFSLAMIFTVNTKLAFSMLLILPFTAYNTYLQTKKIRPAFQRNRDCFSSLNAFVQENIGGNRVIKAFAREEFEIEKFNEENDKFKDAQLAAVAIWRRHIPIFEVLSYCLSVILMIYGSYMVINKEMTLGDLVKVNGYLWMLNTPLRMAGWWINDILRFTTSVEKIYDTYCEEPDVKTPESGTIHKRFKGTVEFKDVAYAADGADIVSDIEFYAKKGQTIGIIGSTGAGKSTIMNLLCRFYDTTAGEVLIDGVNVKEMDLETLRSHIGIAMQDVFLFSDTIKGNIAYGRPESTFEDVKNAAIMADANHFINQMPEGYDTIVGERGVGLSGGQKQRISLARALLKDPSILILDDTTSAVDMETESYIQTQLNKIQKHCTVFVIAYRISSVIDADWILVMDKGRIIEQGTHETLVKQNGYYMKTFKNQYGDIPYDLLKEAKVVLQESEG
jgi:ABC-type multidrug transport system, ATPase and permease components